MSCSHCGGDHVNPGRFWHCLHCHERIAWDGTYYFHVANALEREPDHTPEPTK